MDSSPPGEPEWRKKQREYEIKKARAKALKLRLTCSICSEKAKLNCPCETTQYCSTECQRIDWRDRGHRKACKKIRNERAAEAARAEAPTPPPSPPRDVFYGPAPRSQADEIRARIAAEHEAARLRREANPAPEPLSARHGPCCPICREEWDVNKKDVLRICCCRKICMSCANHIGFEPCPLCRTPMSETGAEDLALIRRHVENEVPEAISLLGDCYRDGDEDFGIPKSERKAAKIYRRAVELGNVDAMLKLGSLCWSGGEGVKVDRKKTISLWRMAGERGHCDAHFNLGNFFRDRGYMKEAVYHYRLAADAGLTLAEHNLGIRYLEGEGVEQDFEEAERWVTKAAAKGDKYAIEVLDTLPVRRAAAKGTSAFQRALRRSVEEANDAAASLTER